MTCYKTQSIFFILFVRIIPCIGLSTVSAPNSISQHVTFSDLVQFSNDGTLRVKKPITAGTELIEWNERACLTAEVAYTDMDVGFKLRQLAPRIGPGFEFVAIATFLGAEVSEYTNRTRIFVH